MRYCDLIYDSVPHPDALNHDPLIYFQQGEEWFPGIVISGHQSDMDAEYQEMLYNGESLYCSKVTFTNYTIDKLCSRIYVSQAGFLMFPQSYYRNNTFNHCFDKGDKVLAMWIQTEWQYFPATIKRVLPNHEYLIEWEDKDPSGIILLHLVLTFAALLASELLFLFFKLVKLGAI